MSDIAAAPDSPEDWHQRELLLMHQIVRLVGRSLAPELVLREIPRNLSGKILKHRLRADLTEPGVPA